MTVKDILESGRWEWEECFAVYRVAADFADESGDGELASGLRLLANLRRKPQMDWRDDSGKVVWFWYYGKDVDLMADWWDANPHHLTMCIARKMVGDEYAAGEPIATFSTFASAVIAAARAVWQIETTETGRTARKGRLT